MAFRLGDKEDKEEIRKHVVLNRLLEELPKHLLYAKNGYFCRLYYRRTHSNFFFTMADLRNRTVVCKTLGSSGAEGDRRYRKSPFAIQQIMVSLGEEFARYLVKYIEFIKLNRLRRFRTRYMFQELGKLGVKIIARKLSLNIAHNGVRSSRLRRKRRSKR